MTYIQIFYLYLFYQNSTSVIAALPPDERPVTKTEDVVVSKLSKTILDNAVMFTVNMSPDKVLVCDS